MRSQSVLDVAAWKRCGTGTSHPLWWGILGLIIIEAMVVLTFLVSYFYLWIVTLEPENRAHRWSPPEGGVPPLLYPSIELGLLAICALTMWWGGVAIKKKRPGLNASFLTCTVCAGAVLWLRWLQFEAFSFSWQDGAYASMVWVLSGFHFMHVTAAMLGTAVIGIACYMGYFTEENSIGVDVDTNYWYFVSFAWLPMYVVIYWLPQWQ